MLNPSTSPAQRAHATPAHVAHHHDHHHGTVRHPTTTLNLTPAATLRPGFSLLRQSLTGRLALALGISALIWAAARSVIG